MADLTALPVDESQIPAGKMILLSEMAEFLNTTFPKLPKVDAHTPYDWWKRHKQGRLSTPLPKPVRMIGLGPMFRALDVIKWYQSYQATKGKWAHGRT